MPGGSRKNANAALLRHLASGCEREEAARKAGVSVNTVKRRLADPRFRAELEAVKTDILDRAVAALADASTEAVDKLGELMRYGSKLVQLGAARAILEHAFKRSGVSVNVETSGGLDAFSMAIQVLTKKRDSAGGDDDAG